MRFELHSGDREALRPLFELAEDSRAELAPGIEVDGIELRDRVWLDLRLDAG